MTKVRTWIGERVLECTDRSAVASSNIELSKYCVTELQAFATSEEGQVFEARDEVMLRHTLARSRDRNTADVQLH